MTIQWDSKLGKRAAERIAQEPVIWLTTTGSDGAPQPRPVWFIWDGAAFIIYSKPDAAKVRHIRTNPQVALNLDSDGDGGDIIVFTGTAEMVEPSPRPDSVPAYLDKYRAGIRDIGMTPDSFSQTYSAAMRVTPLKLRGIE
jgi:PPOX class probable F420-dependent enzyme